LEAFNLTKPNRGCNPDIQDPAKNRPESWCE